jgi:hypothetical protein
MLVECRRTAHGVRRSGREVHLTQRFAVARVAAERGEHRVCPKLVPEGEVARDDGALQPGNGCIWFPAISVGQGDVDLAHCPLPLVGGSRAQGYWSANATNASLCGSSVSFACPPAAITTYCFPWNS